MLEEGENFKTNYGSFVANARRPRKINSITHSGVCFANPVVSGTHGKTNTLLILRGMVEAKIGGGKREKERLQVIFLCRRWTLVGKLGNAKEK